MPLHEPADCETLNLEPEYRALHHTNEYIRIGVVEKDFVSFQMVQFDAQWKANAVAAFLSDEEIDHLIEGLKRAKIRLAEFNAKG